MTQSAHMTAQSWSCDSHWFMLTVRNSGEFVPELQTVEDERSWEQQVSSHLLAEQGASSSGCRGSDSRCLSSGETHATVVFVYVPVQDVEGNCRFPLTAAGMCRLVAGAALLVVFLPKVPPCERPERSGPRLPALPHALPGEGRRG